MAERTNNEWLEDLRAEGERQMLALEALRAFILSRLSVALDGKFTPGNPAHKALVKSTAQKTLSQVLEHLDTYDGRSAFTTWALKIAVRQALWELRQQRSLGTKGERTFSEIAPEMYGELAMDGFLQYLHRVLKEELTENQRIAIRAMIMSRMPKEEVARQLNMERRDYFKMIHDARLRLKRRFQVDGWILGKAKENNG